MLDTFINFIFLPLFLDKVSPIGWFAPGREGKCQRAFVDRPVFD